VWQDRDSNLFIGHQRALTVAIQLIEATQEIEAIAVFSQQGGPIKKFPQHMTIENQDQLLRKGLILYLV
jgi:hypothetical protein